MGQSQSIPHLIWRAREQLQCICSAAAGAAGGGGRAGSQGQQGWQGWQRGAGMWLRRVGRVRAPELGRHPSAAAAAAGWRRPPPCARPASLPTSAGGGGTHVSVRRTPRASLSVVMRCRPRGRNRVRQQATCCRLGSRPPPNKGTVKIRFRRKAIAQGVRWGQGGLGWGTSSEVRGPRVGLARTGVRWTSTRGRCRAFC